MRAAFIAVFTVLTMSALCACTAKTPIKPRAIRIENLPPLGPYAQAVEANGFVFLSGIVAFNADKKAFASANIEAQMAQVFANLNLVLTELGADKRDIVKVTIYLKTPSDFPKLNPLYAAYFKDWQPARTSVPGVNWGRDDVLVELDVVIAR